MAHRFNKHYTRDEARALLPQIRQWLAGLELAKGELEKNDRRLTGLMAPGNDVGGSLVNRWVTSLVDIREFLREFEEREILIKDLERGLVDFPSLMGDKEVFLCWERDEDDIEYWHDIDSGFAGREPL